MSGSIASTTGRESPKDFDNPAQRWLAEIEQALKECDEWFDDARRCTDRYKDHRPSRRGLGYNETFGTKMNIFWSNVQTLAPALFASTPNVVVERRWSDPDDAGRVACQILQRTAQYQLIESDFAQKMTEVVQDRLIAGRGELWLRYEPHFTSQPVTISAGPGAEPMPSGTPPPMPPPPQPQAPPPGPPPPAPMPPPGVPPPGPPGPPQPPGVGAAPPVGGPAAGATPAGAANGPAAAPPPPQPPMPPLAPVQIPPMPPGGIPIAHMLHDTPGDPARKKPEDGGLQIADDGEQDSATFLAFEEVKLDHVHWEDWLCSPARTWAEVRWVARRVFMTRNELAARFGKAKTRDVPLNWVPKNLAAPGEAEAMLPTHMLFARAEVWEIWDKPSRKVIWIATGYNEKLLDEREDPLRLKDFFPTPRPLQATTTTDTMIPVPDYMLYRDQAVMIDSLAGRIDALQRSIKVCGVYDGAQDEIKRIFQEGVENQLIPVNQWGRFAEQGGLKGCIDLLDITGMAEVLEHLVNVLQMQKEALYEVTGISDIIRGTTVASETATAQQIKAGFGTMRLRSQQQEVARFCRDVIRLVCEIVCEHFQPKTMLLVSDIGNLGAGVDVTFAPKAIALLKDDKIRPLRIDVEADSTVMVNQQQEQQARIAFLQTAGEFLQNAIPMVQQNPMLAPLAGKMLLFGIRSFPQGAELEGDFEQAIKAMEDAAKSGQSQPPPDPKMVVAQAQVRNIDSQIQDRHLRSASDAADADAKARLAMAKTAVDKQKADDDAAHRTIEAFHSHQEHHDDVMVELEKARQQAMKPTAGAA